MLILCPQKFLNLITNKVPWAICAHILNMFAPKTSGQTDEVSVSSYNNDETETEKGTLARKACLRNLKSVIQIIKDHYPKICVIGEDL